jgi:hypothetical protein
MNDQIHTPAASPLRNGLTVPIECRAGWVPEPIWTERWKEKRLPPSKNLTAIDALRQPVLPELPRLFYVFLYAISVFTL